MNYIKKVKNIRPAFKYLTILTIFLFFTEVACALFFNLYLKKKVKFIGRENNNVKALFIHMNWMEASNYEYHPYLSYSRSNLSIRKLNNKFQIALLGGSFANDLFEVLQKEKFSCQGSPVTFTNLAAGGYRQPQQLIANTLFLNEIDAFISLEGFNEIFHGPPPCRPTSWNKLIQRFDTNYHENLTYKIAKFIKFSYNRLYYIKNSIYFSKVFLYYSNKSIRNIYFNLHEKNQKNLSDSCLKENKASIEERWLKYLKTQHNLNRTSNKKLITFIQPNQYISGSKTWSNQESIIFQYTKKSYRETINKGYHDSIALINKSRSLKNVIDLTKIYSDKNETLYKDSCCHVNKFGQKIAVKAMLPYIKQKICYEKLPSNN